MKLTALLTTLNIKQTEMELLLRKETTKCRVVERLSGDAHLLFPRGETTVAVRVYYPQRLKQLETQVPSSGLLDFLLNPPNTDRLEEFRDAFKYPVVFFILPDPQLMVEHLSKPNSFVNVAQNIMNDGKEGKESEGNAKTFVVPDSNSVIDTILILLDALHPDRRKLREKYYEHTRSLHFLPDATTGDVPDPSQVSIRVANEIRELANLLGLAAGEDEILMRRLGSLAKIASADYRVLQDIPIDEASKRKLHEFFGSQADPNLPQQHQASYDLGNNHQSFDEMPDYNEFLQEQTQNQFSRQPDPTAAPYQPPMTAPHYGQPMGQHTPFSHHGHHVGHHGGHYNGNHNGYQGGHHHNMMMMESQQVHYRPTSHWLPAQTPSPFSGFPTQNYTQQRQQYQPPPTARKFPPGYTPRNSTMGRYFG